MRCVCTGPPGSARPLSGVAPRLMWTTRLRLPAYGGAASRLDRRSAAFAVPGWGQPPRPDCLSQSLAPRRLAAPGARRRRSHASVRPSLRAHPTGLCHAAPQPSMSMHPCCSLPARPSLCSFGIHRCPSHLQPRPVRPWGMPTSGGLHTLRLPTQPEWVVAWLRCGVCIIHTCYPQTECER